MEETIGLFAKRVDTTVRTLRYYDKKGLLVPTKFNKSNQKLYTRAEWETYQQITVCKHLGMSLEEIKFFLRKKNLSGREMLGLQRKMIEDKQVELAEINQTIERMQRLYELEDILPEELDGLVFYMLDAFRREKAQIAVIEENIPDEELVRALKNNYNDPSEQKRLDGETVKFFRGLRNAMLDGRKFNDTEVQELVRHFFSLVPQINTFVDEALRVSIIEKNKALFMTYFPQELEDFMYEAMTYYFEHENKNAGEM